MRPIRMSRLELAMRVVLEFNEAFNRHNSEGMMKSASDDYIKEGLISEKLSYVKG